MIAIAASIYLVYVLEILKFRRLSEVRLRRLRPDASPAEIEAGVAKDFETGEFQAIAEVRDRDAGVDGVGPRVTRGQQRVGQRQVDQDGVGADHERRRPAGADHRRRRLAAAARPRTTAAARRSSTSSAIVVQPAATRQSDPRAVRQSA